MRRWSHLIALTVCLSITGLAGAGILPAARAQDDALDLIRAAYEDYDSWGSFQATVQSRSNYALAGETQDGTFWQQLERGITLLGWYDMADEPTVALEVDGYVSESGQQGRQTANSDVSFMVSAALIDGERQWRGRYEADPPTRFSLPDDWTPVPTGAVAVDLMGGAYLRQDDSDPFAGNWETWLDAALDVDGPQTVNIDRSSRGDLYLVDIDPEAVVDALERRFMQLTAEADAYLARDILLGALVDNSIVTWGVVLDPTSGELRGQYVLIDISITLDADALAAPLSQVSFELNDKYNVLFSAVNEPPRFPELPE